MSMNVNTTGTVLSLIHIQMCIRDRANGNLKITHNTALAPERIEASKTKTTYTAGDTLNVDDLAVTVYLSLIHIFFYTVCTS